MPQTYEHGSIILTTIYDEKSRAYRSWEIHLNSHSWKLANSNECTIYPSPKPTFNYSYPGTATRSHMMRECLPI